MRTKCIRCHTAEKARGAHKYCTACRIIEQRETNKVNQQIRRQRNYTPCQECNVRMTYTKYCTKCAQIVKLRKDKERYEEGKIKLQMCERCGVNEKWSHIGTTKYCEGCKIIVAKQKLKENQAAKAKNRIVKPRKQPVHKGSRLDPTKQSPTKKAPPILKKDGGINPYFLRRGSPAKNGTSSGFTMFNQ